MFEDLTLQKYLTNMLETGITHVYIIKYFWAF